MEDYIMTNSEIKMEIEQLEERKKMLQMSSFELNAEALDIRARILHLRNECTHTDPDGTYAIDKTERCRYCGRRMHK
jgi:hypothetical protein